ncbi:MAG TPA: aromatic ring-hydroxylating dioxygenase subunit alpha [Caulobacteraceae bacterium]|nr:aromatic ring-hydroxylating dioxygenase subunit alpha [Caulobacteraceae bacterium]
MNDVLTARKTNEDIWSENPLGLDGSRVIDRRIYVDADIFAAEREKIFARTWQWIAHESEIPDFGDYITATVGGRPIVVSRGDEGRITAFLNTCTHRGAILAAHPRGNSRGSFTCFYHGWCFDTEGKFTTAPLAEAYGENLGKGCYDAPTIRHDVFAGNVFVSLDTNVAPLEDFLGAAGPLIRAYTGRHEALGRVRWLLKGNWKLWHENFRDNYHPMFTHRTIGANYQGVHIEGANIDLTGGHSLLAFPSQGNPEPIRSLMRNITGKQPDPGISSLRPRGQGNPDLRHNIMAVFPNLDFQFPNTGEGGGYLQHVTPTSADTAVVELVVFGEVGEPPEARQARLDRFLDAQASSGKISGDDTEAARRCSVGFGTVNEVRWSNMDRGQTPGREGIKNDEYSLRAFYDAYKRHMGDSLPAA